MIYPQFSRFVRRNKRSAIVVLAIVGLVAVATYAIRSTARARHFAELVEALGGDSRQRGMAAANLLDSDAWEPADLLPVLTHGTPKARVTATKILGRLGRSRDREQEVLPLLAGLADDPDEEVRLAALEGLLSWYMAAGRVYLGPTVCKFPTNDLIAILSSPWVDWKVKYRAVVYTSDSEKFIEIAAVTSRDSSYQVRTKTGLYLLDLNDDRAISMVNELLADPDSRVRYDIVFSVERMLDPGPEDHEHFGRFRSALIGLLSDSAVEVAAEAATALGRLGGEQAAEILIRHLPNRPPDFVHGALRGIGYSQSVAASAAVKAFLKHPDTRIVISAAEALGDLGDRSAIPDLVALLESPEPRVIEAAAWALALLGATEAVNSLIEALLASPPREYWGISTPREYSPRGDLETAIIRLASEEHVERLRSLMLSVDEDMKQSLETIVDNIETRLRQPDPGS